MGFNSVFKGLRTDDKYDGRHIASLGRKVLIAEHYLMVSIDFCNLLLKAGVSRSPQPFAVVALSSFRQRRDISNLEGLRPSRSSMNSRPTHPLFSPRLENLKAAVLVIEILRVSFPCF
jgi:hypothetical protein